MKNPFVWFQSLFSSRKMMILFILIFILASFLRLLFLTEGSLLGDEPFYSVRSIGWVDILVGSDQTTPYQWFEDLPWWANLSFHDHPPLVFAINHLFFKLFGDSLFVARFPSALFGIFSVLLIYLITKKIFSEKVALLASVLFGINNVIVFVSRTVLLESVTLFFILSAFYLFLLSLENKKYLLWFGICFGLSVLAKYVALFVLPIYILFVVIRRREYFRSYHLYLSCFLFLLVVSPIIIYSIAMYKSVGHFDVQLSYLFGMATPEWESFKGKELIGSSEDVFNRLSDIFLYVSPLVAAFLISSLLFFLVNLRKLKEEAVLLFLVFVSFLGGAVYSGFFLRFFFYPLVFSLILVAFFLFYVGNNVNKKIVGFFFVGFVVLELIFCLNTTSLVNTKYFPLGFQYINYSDLFPDKNYGIDKLNNFLMKDLDGMKSVIEPDFGVPALDNFVKDYQIQNQSDSKREAKVLIVYSQDIEIRTINWVFGKLSLYNGWPFIDVARFIDLNDFFAKDRFYDDMMIYYVQSTKNTVLSDIRYGKLADKKIIEKMDALSVEPETIFNSQGLPVFKIYKARLIDLQNSIK